MKRSSQGLTTVVMLVILLTALALQSTRFHERPYRQDEAWSVDAAETYNLVGVVKWVSNDIHVPLHGIMLDIWVALVGTSSQAVRWGAFLMTSLTLALVYRLGADLFSRRHGVYAALLLVASDFFMFFSGEARPYPLLALLAALMMWLYVRWLRATPPPKSPSPYTGRGTLDSLQRTIHQNDNVVGAQHVVPLQSLIFILTGTALLYTHFYGAYLLFALGLFSFVIVHERRRLVWTIGAFVMMGVLFIPWLPALYRQITEIYPAGRDTIWGPSRYDFAYIYNDVTTLGGATAVLLLLSVVVFVARAYRTPPPSPLPVYGEGELRAAMTSITRSQDPLPEGERLRGRATGTRRASPLRFIFIAATLLIPIAVAYIVAGGERPFTARNFIVIMPSFALMLAYGLGYLPRIIGIAVLTVYATVAIFGYTPQAITEDYPAITADMQRTLHGGEPLLIDMGPHIWHYVPFAYYFDAGGVLTEQTFALTAHWPLALQRLQVTPLQTLDSDNLIDETLHLIEDAPEFTVVGWFTHPYRDELAARLRDEYAETRRTAYGSILVSEFERIPQTAPQFIFGEMFDLLDMRMDTQAEACSTIDVQTWWRAAQSPDDNYSIGVYLLDESGVVRTQADGAPGNILTLQWEADRAYPDRRSLQLPCEIGRYEIKLALYNPVIVENLPIVAADGEDAGTLISLGFVDVTAP